MKKSALCFVLVVVLISSVSALSTTLEEKYNQGETIIAELTGIVDSVFPEDIEFRRGHVLVPFDFDVKKLGDRYFLWAITPRNEQNYTFIIRDVTTTVQGIVQTIDFEQNFSVSGNLSEYSIRPGVVIATEDFSLVSQLNIDDDKEIDLDFPEERTVTLSPGVNNIDFDISSVEKTELIEASIGMYTVPIYVVTEAAEEDIVNITINVTINVSEGKLRFSPKRIQSIILAGDTRDYEVSIINEGDSFIEEIEIEYNESIFFVRPTTIDNLDINESANITITLLSSVDVREVIYARYFGESASLIIDISLTGEQDSVSTDFLDPADETGVGYFCSEVPGVICSANQVCTGNTVPTLDGTCCLAVCSSEEEGGSGFFIGVILIIVLIIIVFVIWRKYRGVRVKHPLKRITEASKKSLP